MPRTRLTAVAAACLTSIALVAGCSSPEDTDDYVDEVNSIRDETVPAVQAASSVTAETTKEFTKKLHEVKTELDDAVASLDDVDVPDDAQDGHEQYLAGLTDLRDSYAKAIEKADGAKGAELIAITTELEVDVTKISEEIDAAITKINDDIGAS